ncbi:MAG: tetratricopeptide repeat protein [Cytophagaceae bacterium]|jgi:tetratricopeptide (TPR) repeat protein|nr:tetratricopeptide repeat protein [Cytophagaceae bacterium]
MIYKQLFLVSFLLLSFLSGYSQEIKSKKFSSVSSASRQGNSVALLLQKAESLSDKDPKAALDYLEQALSISLQEGDKIGEANTYVVLGNLNSKQKLYAQAINFYGKALPLFEKEKQTALVLKTRKHLGAVYEKNSAYDNALDQYKKGLKEAEEAKNSTEVLAFKNAMANIYKLQGKNEEALTLYKEVLQKEKRKQNKSGEREAYDNMGDVYIQQNKVEEAKEVYQSAQESALQDKDQKDLSKSYDKMANTYKLEGKTEDELVLRKKKAEVSDKRNDEEALAKDYLEIGQLYLTQKKPEQALDYLNRSVNLSKNKGLLEVEAKSQEAISDVYKQQQNYSKALEHYQLYVEAKDSLLSSRESRVNTMISFNDELSLKQKQIDLLEKDMQLNEKTIQLLNEEKSFSKLVIYALIMGLLIVLVSSWMVYINAKKRRAANQSLVLRSLRSQMNPHFIFNALNSVNNFISKNDERSANKYLSDFSKLMRTVMENSRYEFISLATEQSILQLYLSLEHARFKDKFDYTLTVSEELSQEQTQIPPMLIQPYIENAIWHGLRYKEEKGLLTVSILPHGEEVVVTIEDNGIGRKKSAELKTHNQKDKDSIGLKNTEARIGIINELYKTHLRVNIEDLDPVTGSGTKVTLYITQTPTAHHEA